MAPLITTSLREYAMENVRTYERRADATDDFQVMLCATTTRDEWLALQDWTESSDALQPFDDLMDSIAAASKALVDYIEAHDIDESSITHPLNTAALRLEDAAYQAEDCRSIITNVRREDATP